jgi:hypothetical protein
VCPVGGHSRANGRAPPRLPERSTAPGCQKSINNMSSFTELDTFLDSEEASFGLTARARQLVGVILEKAVK